MVLGQPAHEYASKSRGIASGRELAEPLKFTSFRDEADILSRHIVSLAHRRGPLKILEAGCGRSWPLHLDDIDYSLTGIDINQKALDLRHKIHGDLHATIVGDLRTANFEKGSFDVIYSSFVLEHIAGAEQVLQNFTHWLKPGGLIVLRIPNRDSVKGFMTRITPFWSHIFYKKYIRKMKDAGKPGFGPYPTVFDKVVSRRGIYHFCREQGLIRAEEYYMADAATSRKLAWQLERGFSTFVEAISLGRLSADHIDMTYVIRKPTQ